MDKLSRWIRVATAAPILAGCMLVVLYCCRSELIGGAPPLQWGLLCLTVLPLLAYPLQRYIPGFRGRGREGQRSLATVFAVIGYLLGCVGNALLRGTRAMWIVYTEYLLSGLLLSLIHILHFTKKYFVHIQRYKMAATRHSSPLCVYDGYAHLAG